MFVQVLTPKNWRQTENCTAEDSALVQARSPLSHWWLIDWNMSGSVRRREECYYVKYEQAGRGF